MAETHALATRQRALELIRAVLRGGKALDAALENPGRAGELAPRDRAFAHGMALCVLRRTGQLDRVIDAVLDRPRRLKDDRARDILRLGAAQLLYLDTPAHAAVDVTVTLARRRGLGRLVGLVNAALRRIAREGADLAIPDARVGRVNSPGWLWESWCKAYGRATAETIARAHLIPPPLDLTPRAAPERWAGALAAEILPTGTLRRPTGGDIRALPGYEEGTWWVQDAASALPARLLGDLAGGGLASRRVVDLCAAPGGKTAQLAAAGARVTAVDISESRLARLRANLDRLGLEAELVAADATRWQPDQPAEMVLLDAPCTGTGTIRRHPDIPHLKRPADMAALVALQDRLLDNAVAMLAPGGRLVYSTCSLEPEEGEQRVAALRQRDESVTGERIKSNEIGGLTEILNKLGELRSTPASLADYGGLDGFFAARLIRST